MKKKGWGNSVNIIAIIMIVSIIIFIGIIIILLNKFKYIKAHVDFLFNNKKEQEPTYRKSETQDNIKKDGTKNYTDRMKTGLTINSPEINAIINNPDIKGTLLGNLTAVVGDELSFNNGKFRLKESFRKNNVYVYK